MVYFKPIPRTLEELKILYRKLSRQHHPDVGGSEDTMKLINCEYTELFKILKNIHTDANGSKFYKETAETPEQLIILMNQLFKAQKWVDSARNDYYEAECVMQYMNEYLSDVLWRSCYQAAKKYIISLLVFKNIKIPEESNLLDLVDICEKHAKINLSFVYEECARLSDNYIQENEYSGYYVEENDAKQALKNTEKIEYFVTSYFDGFLIGNKKEKSIADNPMHLPLNKIEKNGHTAK